MKQFFNEKEVTSTLVMDALYSGCRQIAEHSKRWAKVGVDEILLGLRGLKLAVVMAPV